MIQRTQEWYNARMGRFTASEIWKLFTDPRSKADKENGVLSATAYQYVFEKAVEAITGQSKSFTSKYTDHGIEFEDHAGRLYGSIIKEDVYECAFFPYGDYAGATPDRMVGKSGIAEIKCPYNTDVHFKYLKVNSKSDLINEAKNYYYQIQMQLLCTDREWCDFITYSPFATPYNMGILRIDRDEDVISDMKKRIGNAARLRDDIITDLKSVKSYEDLEVEHLMSSADYSEIMTIINNEN